MRTDNKGSSNAGNAAPPAFRAAALTYRFEGEDENIINGINFAIEAGSFAAIVGPNGAGKSTLLDIMLGYRKGYAGSLEFFGRELAKVTAGELARERAYIPQQSEDGLRLSAYEYLKLSNADPSKTSCSEIDELLEKLNISYLKNRSIASMSGGEARLVQLVFVLLRKPRVLLLDEPVSYLDYKNQQAFFEILKKEHAERGITVAAILHDLNMAAYYCGEIILINDGRILKQGAPFEVLNYRTLGSVFFGAAGFSNARPGSGGVRGRVHVICGGGSGEKIIARLIERNFSVSCGVLNAGDSDWRFCRANSVPMVEEEPYRPISEENYIKNLEYIKASSAVVVCDFPIGAGNLANLKFAEDLALPAAVNIICAGRDFNELDYTGGAASAYLEKIEKKARVFKNIDEFEKLIDSL
ncbi:MAG TPA: ABC transporter ATP-binding protein [Candidatus Wallbacteria bacterium]|nr:MAG: Hemin import ATP-binding protein HmuV [bacterium ADurb.Bin243]HPG56358.1 ABC transporter ATP-binding protein [Candidatus Wallbacteria bacterium]